MEKYQMIGGKMDFFELLGLDKLSPDKLEEFWPEIEEFEKYNKIWNGEEWEKAETAK